MAGLKRKRGERKSQRWGKSTKDDRRKGKREEGREKKKRKLEEERRKFEEDYPIIQGDDIDATKKSLFLRLEAILERVKSSRNYGSRKNQKVAFSAVVGYTSNTFGLQGFEFEHPQSDREHLGVNVVGPEFKKCPAWLSEIWELSKILLPLYDPSFGERSINIFNTEPLYLFIFLEYCVHVSKMNAKCDKDHLHFERRDVSPAYVLYLGNFQGAYLRCLDENGKELAQLGQPYRFGIFDPRLPHAIVRQKSFRGNRYCLIFFKMWEYGREESRPLERFPRYLDENPKVLRDSISVSLIGTVLKFRVPADSSIFDKE